jgi:alanyl-tRNA synthetase
MEAARDRSRGPRGRPEARAGAGAGLSHERVMAFARSAGFPSRFLGYEQTDLETVLGALEREDGRYLAKLAESPFYPEGGGQVSDTGRVETPSGTARVSGVYRVGGDQAVELEPVGGELAQGETARAVVDRPMRLATMCNHTATHLLHAALRERLGTHVRQAGSYVGPDKLRFDFSHDERLSADEVAAVEERVNGWILDNRSVRAITTTRSEAEAMGAHGRDTGGLARALRRHARGLVRRDRPLSHRHRDLERVECPAHRGGDRTERRRALQGAHA